MHGSLHRSCVTVVYPNLELICDFRRSKLPVPLPEVFVTTRPDPVPKSKTTTRQCGTGTAMYNPSPHPPLTLPTKNCFGQTTLGPPSFGNFYPFNTFGFSPVILADPPR